jgi:formate dehydrogenase iron-sulfur subunit
MIAEPKSLLIDITRCTGCRACERGCREAHSQPVEQPAGLSETSLTWVDEREGRFVRRLCLHCADPPCAAACPSNALAKSSLGPVLFAADKCIGCRYCLLACPYRVPACEWSRQRAYMRKCDLCDRRIAAGGSPACAQACPHGATLFGTRPALLREARRRLLENSAYTQQVYGDTEPGGTSVLYLTDVPLEKLGFPVLPGEAAVSALSEAALGDAPTVVLVGGALLAGLYWITERRKEVLNAEEKHEHL